MLQRHQGDSISYYGYDERLQGKQCVSLRVSGKVDSDVTWEQRRASYNSQITPDLLSAYWRTLLFTDASDTV